MIIVIGPRNFFPEDLWDQSCPSVRPCVQTITANLESGFLWNLVYSFFGSKLRDAQGRLFKFRKNRPSGVKKRPFFAYFWGFLDFTTFSVTTFFIFFNILFLSMIQNFFAFTPKPPRPIFTQKYEVHPKL